MLTMKVTVILVIVCAHGTVPKSFVHMGRSPKALCTLDGPQKLRKKTGRIGNKRMYRYHLDHSIIEISTNSEKGPDDQRDWLKDHQLTLVWKTCKKRINWISSHSSTKQCHKNYVKVRIGRCRLCGDRNKTINHIISKCSKLRQKSIRLEMTGWERSSIGNCARSLNLNKWCMHKSEYVLENEREKYPGILKYKRII